MTLVLIFRESKVSEEVWECCSLHPKVFCYNVNSGHTLRLKQTLQIDARACELITAMKNREGYRQGRRKGIADSHILGAHGVALRRDRGPAAAGVAGYEVREDRTSFREFIIASYPKLAAQDDQGFHFCSIAARGVLLLRDLLCTDDAHKELAATLMIPLQCLTSPTLARVRTDTS